MPNYTYEKCLANSYRINWRIEEVIGGQQFDTSRRWLPAQLSGADAIGCLNETEKTKLTHVEMGAYAHLFGFVEEFITPTILRLAAEFEVDHRPAFDALTNFAAEEVKHMTLFREIRALVNETIGFPATLLGDEKAVAHLVMSKHIGAVLLLTSVIEWVHPAALSVGLQGRREPRSLHEADLPRALARGVTARAARLPRNGAQVRRDDRRREGPGDR